MPTKVLVLSPNAWDNDEFARSKYRGQYEFVFFETGFYERHVLLGGLTFDILDSISRAIDTGRRAGVRGVIGTHDYPASLQAAAVAAGLGLPGPPVDRALLCHHKYLCRQTQGRAVPEATPAFGLIDPFAWSPGALPLPFPFFVKPVKGMLSLRAGLVRDVDALRSVLQFSPFEKLAALTVIRPFNQLLEAYTAFEIHGNYFIAEEVLRGDHQVTVEGFVEDGRVQVMGIVDSIMYPGTISFQRFEYPSRLPESIQARMEELTVRLVNATGFTHGCFNLEMMYDAEGDVITAIEMNPRMCTQFSDLYEKVDGTSGYEVQLALATGRPVDFQRRRGRFPVAASIVRRTFQDRKVAALPGPSCIAAFRQRYPESVVTFLCEEGRWLSQQPQDRHSYRYGIVNVGAGSYDDLDAARHETERLLPVRFADSPSRPAFLPTFRS